MAALEFWCSGVPAPQGSKSPKGTYVGRDGKTRALMVESSKKVKPWRLRVEAAVREALPDGWAPLDGPLELDVVFWLPRPGDHYGTGRNAGVLKEWARDLRHTTYPDDGKLVRSTEDAMKLSGAMADDSRIVVLVAEKRYEVGDGWTGAWVLLSSAGPVGDVLVPPERPSGV